jgi:hypothetical protein
MSTALPLLVLLIACTSPTREEPEWPAPSPPEEPVDLDGDGVSAAEGDCNDEAPDMVPGGAERCDAIDNDCDGLVDEDLTNQWFYDADDDGFGDDAVVWAGCDPMAGFVPVGGDCDDLSADTRPGAAERCNGVDDDCNGTVDDAPEGVWVDADGDGFGDPATPADTCEGSASNEGDCDDGDGEIHPAAADDCDDLDDDCDGVVDGGLRVPGDHRTVQEAIDAAEDGGTVCLDEGTHAGNIDLRGKSLSFVGRGVDETILEGDGTGSVVTIEWGETVSFRSLKITGGNATYGSGVYAVGADITLEDVAIAGNNCDADTCFGVAMYLYDSDLTATQVGITNNSGYPARGFGYGAAGRGWEPERHRGVWGA